MTDKIKQLAKQMRCGLYVDYGTDLESAFNAANIIATSSKEPAAVFTALFGVVNTLCNIIEEEASEEVNDAKAPPFTKFE
jgi:hypothetical protein